MLVAALSFRGFASDALLLERMLLLGLRQLPPLAQIREAQQASRGRRRSKRGSKGGDRASELLAMVGLTNPPEWMNGALAFFGGEKAQGSTPAGGDVAPEEEGEEEGEEGEEEGEEGEEGESER